MRYFGPLSDRGAGGGARTNSADSRAGDRSDGDRGVSGRGGGVGGGGDATAGELDVEAWEAGVRPAFVMLDLGLMQRQGSYSSGTVFQAALMKGVSGAGNTLNRSQLQ